MNNKVLILSFLILSLLAAALVSQNGSLVWMTIPILVYLAGGVYRSPAREKIKLRAERFTEQHKTDGVTTVNVQIKVQNQGQIPLYIQLRDKPPKNVSSVQGSLCQNQCLLPQETNELAYSFQSQRGNFTWKNIQAIVSDPFGLIETPLNLPASGEVFVYPETKNTRSIPIRPESTLHAPGSIPARLGGSGTDFWGIREYHPGDSLRWLDWRLTARHPHQYFTKEFEQEEIADIGIILDARQKSDVKSGEDSLFEHTVKASATLAEAFLHQGHRLSLLVFGEKILNVFPDYGKIQLQRILRCLSQARVGANSSLDSLEYIPIRLFPSHSLLIIMSPLAPNDRVLFPRLRALGYQVLLISPDPVNFYKNSISQDISSQMALRAARLERHLLLRDVAEYQIPVIDWQVDTPLVPLLRSTFKRPGHFFGT